MNQLDVKYFDWLVAQIAVPRGRTMGELFERMHNLEFVWTVPNDDNRVQDAIDLRNRFRAGGRDKLNLNGATILEVLVSLSHRVAFTAGGDADIWAWRLLKNLRLHKMSDPLSDQKRDQIDDILYALVWRTYQPDGRGGFFPLKNPTEDQTKVEIWFQMNAYVIEMNHR